MYVAPKISEDEALRILSQRKSTFPMRRKGKSTPPKRIELIHLPFYAFTISLSGDPKDQEATISLDGLLGSVLFFVGDGLKGQAQVDNSVCDFVLSPTEAERIALQDYKRTLLEHGLRNRKEVIIEKVKEMKKLFYPFWIGYFEKGEAVDFKALDAVSGEIQGIKMRRVLLKAFRQMDAVSE